MEYQERQLLGQFLQKLTQARVDQRDREAESLIREACAAQPDAAYLLVQRTMLLEQALAEAHGANAHLQSELSAARSDRPLVSDQNAWGTVPSLPNASRNSMATARPDPLPMSQPAMAAAPAAPAASAWGGSFLGTVASTAVGVAAGSFLFHGLSNAFGNNQHAAAPANPQPTQPLADSHEAVTNNAYDDATTSAGGLDDLGPGGDEWA